MRSGADYKQAIGRLERLVSDYGMSLGAIDAMATRSRDFHAQMLTLRVKPQLVESAVAVWTSVRQGLHHPAKREMRFLVEASIKALWFDRRKPDDKDGNGNAPRVSWDSEVGAKVAALDDVGKQRFSEIVAELNLSLLHGKDAKTFRETATDLYAQLSTHVHLSGVAVAKQLRDLDRDKRTGFETVGEVNAIADLFRKVLDVSLTCHLEAFDVSLVGDLFANLFDDYRRWSFHKSPLVASISRYFDYKAERKINR
jgi:hypothetical protein